MTNQEKKELSVTAIQNGTVIDHIPADMTLRVVALLSKPNDIMTIGINLPSKTISKKGFVKITNRFLTQDETSKIALIAPTAVVNIIKNYQITSKGPVSLPNEINGIIKCKNPSCVSNFEKMLTKFILLSEKPLSLRCHYCERSTENDDFELN